MSSIFPEKIAMYFASMNPLSAKIFADIQAVEESVKIDNNLSYNEKSKIIDKHLIYDVIRRNQKKQQHSNSSDHHHQHPHSFQQVDTENEDPNSEDIPINEIFYNDPELDKDQVTALLTSVYPKKPEKYIYDDNSFYLDEHSEPFSYCTQNQAKYCDLEKLVKSLPVLTSPPPCSSKSNSKSRIGGSHSVVHNHNHPHREKQQAPLPNSIIKSSRVRTSSATSTNVHEEHHGILNHEYIDTDDDISVSIPTSTHKIQGQYQTQKQLSTTKPKSGSSVLGISIMGFGSGSSTNSNQTKKKAQKEFLQEDPEQTTDDSNLPNQVQNSDLIAELQAKLKLNKGKSKSGGLQHTPSIKVSKPKAPPPPPPDNQKIKIPGIAVKVSEPPTLKNSNDFKKTSVEGIISSGSEMNKIPKEASTIKKTNANGNSFVEPELINLGNGTSSPKKMTTEEFTVDVSSPCRIATPKTGFDFLDNW